MDLHSAYPFWMIKEGILGSFPKLHDCTKAEVVVVGAGITGALIAHRLCEAGIDVVVLEKRHVAHGSTSASTAMLQYEIDIPLFDLSQKIGKKKAVRAYRICSDAIDEIGRISKPFGDQADFQKLPSLYYASYAHHDRDIIQPEFKARKSAGFEVSLLSESDIRKEYGFSAASAIRSAQGGHVNPYKLCHHLLADAQKKGARIYDSIEITRIEQNGDEVQLWSGEGLEIKARHVIVACGYESQRYLPVPVTLFNASYAIVSTPLDEKHVWKDNALVWETKTPYLYMRTTADRRIIVGGRDERTADPARRDSLLPFKKLQLENDFRRLFPGIPFDTDFAWAGVFGETEDGLPYIGSYDQDRIHYAMNYGGNGITFSVAAAHILTDAVRGKKNADAALFSFDRLKKVRKPGGW
ncbi:MAG TPA: FAD-dependent oxidoreductase [Saprospiraceae bacterium]|nr:FAD-dependent oxidoreductase [Saprospiraceae bacterium]HPI05728.1 FAD-dependent oxidoreductase [Saprospiraceae bacterium]